MTDTEKQTKEMREAAPPNNLPAWDECSLRVENSDFIAKRIADGGHGPDQDSELATELHRFIYEYDDEDPYRSAWFMHRLELVIEEAAKEAATKANGALLQFLVDCDAIQAGGNLNEQGLCDAIDNDGCHYQSAALAEWLDVARKAGIRPMRNLDKG